MLPPDSLTAAEGGGLVMGESSARATQSNAERALTIIHQRMGYEMAGQLQSFADSGRCAPPNAHIMPPRSVESHRSWRARRCALLRPDDAHFPAESS